jgi:hypothetical protein
MGIFDLNGSIAYPFGVINQKVKKYIEENEYDL